MVELATFRTFPRESPGRQSEAAVAERDVPVERGTLTTEALPTRFTQELRARRRAARTDMRQSETWAEPERVPAPPYSSPEPDAVHAVDEVVSHAPPVLEDESALAVLEPPAPQIEHEELTYAQPPIEESTELPGANAFAPNMDDEWFAPEPPVQRETPPAPLPETIFEESAYPLPSRPVSIHEFLAEAATPAETLAPVVKHLFEGSETPATARETLPAEQSWPIEPPSVFGDEDTIPIAPPTPLGPEIGATAALTTAPDLTQVLEADRPDPMLRTHYSSEPLPLDYRLLGLANPLVVTVTGRLGDTNPVPLIIGRTGIYRPNGFRPAPWSGFAYDISPDGRTGLVLGTRILTARGEVPVEDLVPGDNALALRGPALLPIVWIGRSIAAPPPVEIDADAFGPGRPSRTLRVGADHPIFIATMPVSARDLVNGDSIRTLDTETAELFHIDVGVAEVLLAEGVPLASGCR